jgi:hypothetical protein
MCQTTVETETIEQQQEVEVVEVVEEKKWRQRARLNVSLPTVEIPKVERCCVLFDLRLALNVWLPIEALIWLFLFIVAFYNEIDFIDRVDLMDFIEITKFLYFQFLFGDRVEGMDQKDRSKNFIKLFLVT